LSYDRYPITTDFYRLEYVHEAGFLWRWCTNTSEGSCAYNSADAPEVELRKNFDDRNVEPIEVV
jgi:hypothetical protein